MEKIKVGHIGTRHDHSRAKLEAIKKFPHLFEVVGIVPEDEKVAERIKNDAVYGGIPIMTEEELFAVEGLELVLCEGDELDSVASTTVCTFTLTSPAEKTSRLTKSFSVMRRLKIS